MTFENWWKINFDMDEGAIRDAVEDFLKPHCQRAFEAGAGAANKAITELAAIQSARRSEGGTLPPHVSTNRANAK